LLLKYLLKYSKYIRYIFTFRYIKLISYWSARYLHNKMKEEVTRESQNLNNPNKKQHKNKYYYTLYKIFHNILQKILQIINKIISLIPLGRKISLYISKKYLQYLQFKKKEKKPKKIYNRYTYYYGFQIIIGGINKFILLIISGLLLNILPQLLLTTLSFVPLRLFSGGLHLNNYTKCLYFSLLTFIVFGLLAKYIILNQTISIAIFIFVFILILIYAPVEHPNRPLNENKKIRFKIIALLVLTVLYLTTSLTNNIIITNSITFGILLAGLITLPVINKLK